MYKKIIGVTAAITLSLALTACGGDKSSDKDKTLGEQVDHKIVGIDPGAGLMKMTIEEALPQYGLDDWNVVEGSGAAMTASLKKAYDKKEPIVITGWSPHWMFSKYDLKYLEDPKGVYGKAETVNTIAREGLEKDHPNAYKILDQFEWTQKDVEEVMATIQGGTDAPEAAEKWASENKELVSTWTKGMKNEKGEIKILYVAWDDVIATSYVVENVLESVGFKVKLIQVDAGPMYAGVANGSGDALVGAWLPTAHEDYYAKYEGKFKDLGPNLKGTKLGIVVPSYMDIDSIEDLKTK
jgi:glycine betaine/proline transport system substrate-binding protein